MDFRVCNQFCKHWLAEALRWLLLRFAAFNWLTERKRARPSAHTLVGHVSCYRQADKREEVSDVRHRIFEKRANRQSAHVAMEAFAWPWLSSI